MDKKTQVSRYGVGSKIAGVFLSAAMLASSFLGMGGVLTVPTLTADAAGDYGLADNIQDGTILHCFDWKYNDIKAELKNIAEAGFTSVQTSPAQPDGTGSWYWLYQPKGFYVGTNGLGTKAELQALCSEAEKYGIKIVVDVVANHLNGQTSSVQSDLQNNQYWHTYGDVSDWNDRYQVIYGEIGMRDLATENSYVQSKVKGYVEELKGLGVDGIRWDAAKHIGLPGEQGDFWPTVTSVSGMWNYGEILDSPGGSDPVGTMKEYTQYIGITDAGYGHTLRNAQRSGKVPTDYANWAAQGLSSDRIVYWGESHDTWANAYDWGYSHDMSQNQIDRCYAIVAARSTATSLYFSRPFSDPSKKENTTVGSKGSTHFTSAEVAEVNKFHNAMIGKKDYYAANSDGSACAITRQDGGAVIVKGSGSGSVTVTNGGGYVPAGTYTDKVSGGTFTVTSTTITGSVGDSGIAVIYDSVPVTKSAKVSASPAGGSFTTSVTATLNVANAASGTYKTSDGQSGTYTDGKTITFGSSTAVGSSVTLTLSATGEDGVKKTETYTFTKKDPTAVTTIYFDNSSYKWSTVYAYVYDDGTGGGGGDGTDTNDGKLHFRDSDNWGTVYAYFFAGSSTVGTAWPGTAMTKGSSDYSIAVPSGATHVVFNNGNNGKQTADLPVSGVYGYNASGATYTSIGSGADTTLKNADWPGVQMTLDATTGYYMYEVPSNLVNGRVIFIESKSATTNRYPADKEAGLPIEDTTKLFSAGNSWKAYTPVKPDPQPDVPTVTANKATGTSFSDETMSLTLTLANATSGTYSVDGGPTKTFTSSATFNIGEGKIGDSTVTVETTAKGSDGTTKNYTFTYEKKYVIKTTSSSASALGGKYATNPNNQKGGAGVTITKASDFKDTMIIAQGVANDDARIFRGSHEAPVYDTYALYAAWDDTNLYLGWQFTNVTDVVDPAQGYPISDNGKPWNGDIPQMLAFDLGKGKSADMSKGNMSGGKYVWGLKVGFDTRVDALMCFSSKPGVGKPSLFKTDSTGYFSYDESCITGFTAGGITLKYEDGFIGTNGIMGINKNGWAGYTPADLQSTSSEWVDFTSKGHSKAQDTFYYITIPLATLGVTRSYIESTGIGVMHISTFGESGITSIPMDMTMLDCATESYSADESTSAEKEDVDTVTVPLARIGAGQSEGGDDPIPVPGTPLQVNFGTDKSAPQLTTTALTIKGIGIGGTAPYKYEFSVDGTVVKASNTTATYTWKPGSTGKHTLKCVITDSTGATATATKTFTAEGTDVVTDLANNSTISKTSVAAGTAVKLTAKASGGTAPYLYTYRYRKSGATSWTTVGASNVSDTTKSLTINTAGTYEVAVLVKDSTSKVVSKTFTLTVTAASGLANNSTISKTSVAAGTAVKLTAKASGGTSPYLYTYRYRKSGATSWKTIGSSNVTAATKSLTINTAGTYEVAILVKDSTSKIVSKTFTLTVTTASGLTNNSTISATSVTAGTAVKLTAKATGGTSPYLYTYRYRKSGATSWSTLGSSNVTTATKSFTLNVAGTYEVAVLVKDSTAKVVSKTFTLTVKSAAAALANSSTISATSISLGSSVKLTAKATGGTSPYTYTYQYKKSTASSYSTLGSSNTTTTTATFKPAAAGNYYVRVLVKDSTGTVASKIYSLTVK